MLQPPRKTLQPCEALSAAWCKPLVPLSFRLRTLSLVSCTRPAVLACDDHDNGTDAELTVGATLNLALYLGVVDVSLFSGNTAAGCRLGGRPGSFVWYP